MKINKHVLTLLFSILLLGSAFSQQQISFNKLYNPDNLTSEGGAILTKGNGYLITAIEWGSVGDTLIFLELDSIGNQVKVIRFFNDTFSYGCGYGTLVHTHDGGYCFAGDIETPVNFYHYFIRFDNNLDTLWTKMILQTDTLQEDERQLCETSDNGFVMVGEKWEGGYITNVLLLKIDSLGNQLWKKTIATGNLSAGWQIRETPDKGLLICGYRVPASSLVAFPFILKTDSEGNFIWDNFPNSQQYNGGGAIAVTKEGDYLFAYGYGIGLLSSNSTDYYYSKINIIKYNPQFGILWNYIYDTITFNLSVIRIDTLPNGDFYVLSNCIVGNPLEDNQYNALLMKFNANGDSLWANRYSYSADNLSNNILYDGVATNDGGFIGCGYVWGYPDLMQQIWVVKTDSNGYAPGMQYLGIKEINNKEDVKVFPNPAKDNLTIETISNTEQRLEILNLIGQTVYTTNINKKATINTSAFANGVYILKLSSDKETVVRKFVKE